jgi:hypothetical protein
LTLGVHAQPVIGSVSISGNGFIFAGTGVVVNAPQEFYLLQIPRPAGPRAGGAVGGRIIVALRGRFPKMER